MWASRGGPLKTTAHPHPQNYSCLPDPSRHRDGTGQVLLLQTEWLLPLFLPCHDSCISFQVVPVRRCVKVTRESSGPDLPTSRALTGFTRQISPEPMEGQSSPPCSTEMLLSRESLHILEEGLPVEEGQKESANMCPA